jgi:hypothetical protein
MIAVAILALEVICSVKGCLWVDYGVIDAVGVTGWLGRA